LPRSASALRGTSIALLGLAAAASLVATPVLPVVQAVITYDGAVPSAGGVRVVQVLPALHMAVVRGDAASLGRLVASGRLRGLAPDDAVQLTDNGDDQSSARSVLASEGLGGAAGQPGAGAGVRVAVIDTGVSDTAALNRASGRLVDAVDTSTGTALTGGVYDDGYGHGTFMSNIVAGGPVDATGGQALGVAPAATVLVVRVATPDGETSLSKVLAGLQWVADHHSQVNVANLSLSHRRPQREYGADPLTDAVEAVRAAGVTVVVSAGNRPGEVGDPGFDPRVLTVGAADLDRQHVATFSGSDVVAGVVKPDVVASGVKVLGLLPPASVLANAPGTTHLDNGLFRGTGTSQATAVASGLAALVLQAHPEATPTQVKASIRCAATSLHGKRDGAGLVHATTQLCSGPDGQALDGSGDATGEATFDASSWGASSWGASSWGASSWGASSWGASSWGASSWGASSWAASSWAASSWAASSWASDSWDDGGVVNDS
jgi:serine protease AprX